MTTDLWMLTVTALLSALIPLIYLYGRLQKPGGIEYGLGNRDGTEVLAPYAERAKRAHSNLTENLGLFAVLVLVAHVTGKANAMTALGATIFFVARVAHIVTYVMGMTPARTLAFFAGMIGEILILVQILR
jgi:uncharacterized MAPEG superfamily protein